MITCHTQKFEHKIGKRLVSHPKSNGLIVVPIIVSSYKSNAELNFSMLVEFFNVSVEF